MENKFLEVPIRISQYKPMKIDKNIFETNMMTKLKELNMQTLLKEKSMTEEERSKKARP